VKSELTAGLSLSVNQYLKSSDGRFQAIMQSDGNFVLYGPSGALWSSKTASAANSGSYIVMQGDGNLVIYNPAGRATWSSATAPSSGDFLAMQSDGNLVIYSGAGKALWASNTVVSAPVVAQPVSGTAPVGSYGVNDYPDMDAIDCKDQFGIYAYCKGGTYLSPRRFAYRNCTDLVAWRLGITYGYLKFPGGDGNARGWKQGALNSGYQTSPTPRIGAVAWWWTGSANDYGHVAVVIGVNPNGTANIEEYNYLVKGGYGTRNNVTANSYLYLK
jgi:surface antigen